MKKHIIIYMLPVALGACGGGGGGGSTSADSPVATASPTPSPASPTPASPTPAAPTPASPTPAAPTPAVTPLPTAWSAVAGLYDVQPDIAACRAGTLKAAVKSDFLSKLNAIRALHGLPAVTYSDAEDQQEMESSLMMVANGALSHTPPSSWTCYSSTGATGAGSSNLILGLGTGLGYSTQDDHLAGWLTEGGSASIGHRRWILSPFLGKTSYGRVTAVQADGRRVDAGSMRVFSFSGGTGAVSGVPAFVAYPYGDYPNHYFRVSDYLSFTAIPSATGGSANGAVDYSRATITVTGPSGALTVGNVASDNSGYGVANNIQWRVTGLAAGTTYTVRISGVAGSSQSEYSYSFRII